MEQRIADGIQSPESTCHILKSQMMFVVHIWLQCSPEGFSSANVITSLHGFLQTLQLLDLFLVINSCSYQLDNSFSLYIKFRFLNGRKFALLQVNGRSRYELSACMQVNSLNDLHITLVELCINYNGRPQSYLVRDFHSN